MDADRELEVARLTLRKEETVALFQSRSGAWRNVQMAMLGAVGLSYLGWFSGSVRGFALGSFAALAGIVILLAEGVVIAHERDFRNRMGAIRTEIETLKRKGPVL